MHNSEFNGRECKNSAFYEFSNWQIFFIGSKQGYKQEFNKIQANHTTRIEREELLRGSGISSNSGLSRRDMYLKENTHLGRYDHVPVDLYGYDGTLCELSFHENPHFCLEFVAHTAW